MLLAAYYVGTSVLLKRESVLWCSALDGGTQQDKNIIGEYIKGDLDKCCDSVYGECIGDNLHILWDWMNSLGKFIVPNFYKGLKSNICM